MFGEKDHRDSNEKDPDKYFAYTAPRCSPKTTFYILKTDLDSIKEGKIPQERDFGTGGAAYYRNTDGRYAGVACGAHFLSSKEVQDYMIEDAEFVQRAIENNVTWFLPKDVTDIFVF
jgi:hypothetical protein